MDILDTLSDELITSANNKKRQAMAVANFVKAGKAKRYLETLAAMADGETIANPWVFVVDATIYISQRVEKLDSFKGDRIQGILTALEFLNPDDTKVTDYASSLNKEFVYIYRPKVAAGEVQVTIRVCIDAYAKSDSPTCKKVIKGYAPATEPTPIYEIVCSDEPMQEGEEAVANASHEDL